MWAKIYPRTISLQFKSYWVCLTGECTCFGCNKQKHLRLLQRVYATGINVWRRRARDKKKKVRKERSQGRREKKRTRKAEWNEVDIIKNLLGWPDLVSLLKQSSLFRSPYELSYFHNALSQISLKPLWSLLCPLIAWVSNLPALPSSTNKWMGLSSPLGKPASSL